MAGPAIADVIQHYYPDWCPPVDTGREWIKCLCPFHAERVPSAGISYEHDAFVCHGCGVKGDVYGIIRNQERVSFAKAKRIAETISPGSHKEIREQPARKPGRRVFGEPGAATGRSAGPPIRSRIRSRPAPWS
ncbi:CHC2 zinc finger domain-containing protein [Streptomyces sp. NPDC014724]|uniref:CHC2 zinc finger domain-containing protein n=1 Tax=Actinomycetes TaxID=1760 RepID=UPI0009E9D033|nr:CHC2 zinc finger domain-containing protein [Nocardia farcinica]AXK86565.1 hypothetical protein DXT66_13845 [Nocardia farcinica]